ncbi:MAG: aminopeptidase [Candidatus Lokiarchaeota archaeon]|nr:aminopeptidase [Candidatus Lokiarchaeota archaeon]
MNEFEMMKTSAKNYMIHVMNLKKEDIVLVVSDEYTKNIGNAFHDAAIDYGCTAQIYLLPEKLRPLLEIPAEMSEFAKGKSIIINVFKGSGEETPFRAKWIKEMVATKSIRIGHGPSITKSMMLEGPMNVDYEKMVLAADKMIKSFDNAKIVHVTAPGGSDIVLDIEERAFSTDAKIIKEPYFANLPCGEIWCGPIESRADGIIVCDGSIGDIGKVKKPLKIYVKNGKIINLESKDQKLVEEVEILTSLDEEARIIGELGIGLNPGAKLSGILLEDEKALGTAHIAFGNNENMKGGQNRSKTHRDFLFYKPTINVTYKDGSTKTVVKYGEFCF